MKLERLYKQKEQIEKEIAELELQLKKPRAFSKQEKIEIFKSLFIARDDIYAKKWISQDGQKQGFYPVTSTF